MDATARKTRFASCRKIDILFVEREEYQYYAPITTELVIDKIYIIWNRGNNEFKPVNYIWVIDLYQDFNSTSIWHPEFYIICGPNMPRAPGLWTSLHWGEPNQTIQESEDNKSIGIIYNGTQFTKFLKRPEVF